MGEVFKHAFMDRPFPWLSYLFPDVFHVNEKRGHAQSMKKMFEEVIKEHQDNLDHNSESLVIGNLIQNLHIMCI